MTRRQIIWFIVFAIASAVCLNTELVMKGFYGISADESGRTLDALQWISRGTPISDVWLPFHRIVVGLGILLFHDLFITPRVISFLFGLSALTAVIWLAHELFHDRRITCLTAIAGRILPAPRSFKCCTIVGNRIHHVYYIWFCMLYTLDSLSEFPFSSGFRTLSGIEFHQFVMKAG